MHLGYFVPRSLLFSGLFKELKQQQQGKEAQTQ